MKSNGDQWIGVLGGGQLGRMLSLDARRMGFKVLSWTGGDQSGAANTADKLLHEPFDDPEALEKFTQLVNVATVEFENLPKSMLEEVEQRSFLSKQPSCFNLSASRKRKNIPFKKWLQLCKLSNS